MEAVWNLFESFLQTVANAHTRDNPNPSQCLLGILYMLKYFVDLLSGLDLHAEIVEVIGANG